ncbi:hypothetical protein MTsPCn9_28480 [Croceitalea sp. MTPC9]|uniref:LytR/AlgR family response regulator transcription factor n=1 Tax=unclassified Croceitalea TaxID=2632280 RepID=UPI002B36768B|nr:hypothetical protein MTsPCn6_29970 [Croceitalea sp. MTPC6]GMN17908.1 hypothetical protein MTsPCn9_28480 [Croceitalea sp. MTPC9]
MKQKQFSTKWKEFWTLRKRFVFWGIILLAASINYYNQFFTYWPSFLLSLLITLEVMGMFYLGYQQLSRAKTFPHLRFWSYTLLFTFFRLVIVYHVLQHHLPEWTVFHYPGRTIPFLFFTSAAFLFLGYSYSIYEWGLAAREEYNRMLNHNHYTQQHPLSIRSEGKTIRLLPQEILYLEAKGEYINYVTVSNKHMCFQRMKKAEKELQEYGFLRAHRSYIINPMNVKSFSNSEVQMNNNITIPVSKTYKESLLKSFDILDNM